MRTSSTIAAGPATPRPGPQPPASGAVDPRRGVIVIGDARRGPPMTGRGAAREDVLVFLDASCRPGAGAIGRLAAAVSVSGGMALVTPAVRAPGRRPGVPRRARHGVRVDLEDFEPRAIGLGRMWRAGPGRPYESPALAAGAFAVARPLYEELGGLDPELGPAGLAEVDLGLRAWLSGHAVLHEPGAVVEMGPSPGRASRGADATRLAGRMRLARKLFLEATWREWSDRARGCHPRETWEAAWEIFRARRRSLEAERARFLGRRRHDERWYAARYGLPWPGGYAR